MAKPDSDTAKARSEGQQLLERLLATRNKLGEVSIRLHKVRGSIATERRQPPAPSDVRGGTASTFFDGLKMLVDECDRVAAELDAGVDDLEKLF